MERTGFDNDDHKPWQPQTMTMTAATMMATNHDDQKHNLVKFIQWCREFGDFSPLGFHVFIGTVAVMVYAQKDGKNKWDFSFVLKVCREFDDVTSAGKLFHVCVWRYKFYRVIQKGALKKGASNRTSVFTAITHAVRCSLMSRIY